MASVGGLAHAAPEGHADEYKYHEFPPNSASQGAHISSREQYDEMYRTSIENPDKFWGDIAKDFHWQKRWQEPTRRFNFDVRKGPVKIEWFVGAETNLAYNCLDRHVEAGHGDRVAFHWEGNDLNEDCRITYKQLLDQVCQLGNYLKSIGVKRGSDVTIYMPMIPELPAAMLACARIGAVHSVVFAGFSAEALSGRILDSKPSVVLTASAVKRGAKPIDLKKVEVQGNTTKKVLVDNHVLAAKREMLTYKESWNAWPGIVDTAVQKVEVQGHTIKTVLVYDHILAAKRDKGIVDTAVQKVEAQGHTIKTVLVYDHVLAAKREKVNFKEGQDVWWQDVVPKQSTHCPVEWMGAEEPLFKLYTSGSTGKPKGVEHTLAGYMVGASTTFKYVFDHRESDIYWCTADCGWITGHSYVTYGPMVNGATQVLFEGVPTYPDASRAWDIVDKYKVTLLYTAPTAIRALQSFGDDFVKKSSRKSLRILGTVGEPINPEAWKWYHEVVGEGRCPIVDTWWQTETGSHMITPLPGATTLKPGSATLPFFGIEPAVLNEKGEEMEGECEGYLVIKKAWPSSMRTLSGDHERFETTYFKVYPGYYFTGDGCRRDKDGYYWLIGRVDDVINVSGHRIGTAEVEGALTQHPQCAEAAVVPMEHPIKGQGIYAYITLMVGTEYPPPASLKKELIATVREVIGPIATPDVIHWAPGLPKTRSGKIMRRILRKIASKEEDQLGDTSTLADPSVVQTLLKMRGQ